MNIPDTDQTGGWSDYEIVDYLLASKSIGVYEK